MNLLEEMSTQKKIEDGGTIQKVEAEIELTQLSH